MQHLVTILTDGYADWETALLNAVARGYYGVDTHYASPGGRPVTSSGGLRVLPDLVLEALDPDAFDAIIVCGGTIWRTPEAPDLAPLLQGAAARGRLVAGICDGVLPLARAGLLDATAHTGNGPGSIEPALYGGAGFYRDGTSALRAGKVVTAGATMPVSFMGAVLEALGVADDDLRVYMRMHAAEHEAAKAA